MRLSHYTTRLLTILLIGVCSLTASAADKRPGGTAFIKSLVVPGWGQYSLGQKNSALAFFGADLALIGGMLTLNAYGHSTKADYHALAAAYAGVTGNHSKTFYVDVGNWMTVDQFNEQRLRNREYDALYTSASDRWAWDSNAHRDLMKQTRIKSDRALNSVLYLVGGMVLNHVASAIHAGRLAVKQRDQQTDIPQLPKWDVEVQPVDLTAGLRVRLTHSF
jgi:hypothetical protein